MYKLRGRCAARIHCFTRGLTCRSLSGVQLMLGTDTNVERVLAEIVEEVSVLCCQWEKLEWKIHRNFRNICGLLFQFLTPRWDKEGPRNVRPEAQLCWNGQAEWVWVQSHIQQEVLTKVHRVFYLVCLILAKKVSSFEESIDTTLRTGNAWLLSGVSHPSMESGNSASAPWCVGQSML